MLKKIVISMLAISQLAPAACPQQGPNRFQASPVLTSAVNNNGVITVTGSLSTFRRCTTYRIQFFGNPANRNPITEGADLLGSTTVTTNNSGTVTFTVTLPPTQFTDGFMSATATVIECDGDTGDTSMFSPNIVIS
jgi:hypothetical protein